MPLPNVIKHYAEGIANCGVIDGVELEKLSRLREEALLYIHRYKEHKKVLAENEMIKQQVSEWLKQIDESKTEAI